MQGWAFFRCRTYSRCYWLKEFVACPFPFVVWSHRQSLFRGTNEWLVAWLTSIFKARLVHWMEITTGRIIFITGNKICYNGKTGSFFSKAHARFSALEAFSLTNAKLECPIFAPLQLSKSYFLEPLRENFEWSGLMCLSKTEGFDNLWVILSFKLLKYINTKFLGLIDAYQVPP